MSLKIERRLRLRKKSKCGDTPLKLSVFSVSPTRKSNSCSITDFKIETTSNSPMKVDTNSQKKIRKKKIRSTQDFNQLDNSSTSQDSGESAKGRTKKTKKSNKIYNLPRISRVAEDFFSSKTRNIFSEDELIQKKKTKSKSRKHVHRKTIQDSHSGDRRKNDYKNKQDNVDGSDKNLKVFSELQSKESIEDLSTEEYQSASSVISDEEIIIKDKTKLKKKKCNINNIEEGKKDTAEKYAKRIRKLLSDTLIRSSKSSNTSNVSLPSTPLSAKKSEQIKRISTKQMEHEMTPDIGRQTICGNKQNETGRQSASTRLSHRINSTPYPKMKISNSPYVDVKEKEKLSNTERHSMTNLSENILPESESIKVKNKKGSGRINTLTVNVSFDMDSSSDDVFYNTFEKKDNWNTDGNQQVLENEAFLNNNSGIKIRKSVRFQSPHQEIRRETLVITDKCGKDDTMLTQNLSEKRRSSTTKRNSTIFETTSPKVINQVNSYESVSQNLTSTNNSFKKQNTPYKQCEANTSKLSKEKYSTELLSPINKSLRKSKNEKDNITVSNSIIDLTTPASLKKIDPGVTYSSEKLNNNDSKDNLVQFDRRATFSMDQSKSIAEDNGTLVPSLIRTATFTIDDETVQPQGPPLDLNYSSSPLPSNMSCSKIIDTSKVNKRRRWDKSRLSVSFLDNSVDIGNISAPWQENDSIKNLSNLETSTSKQSLGLKCNSKNKVSFRTVRTPPSGSSTPFAKGKSTLLRQALLKDKKDVTMNESKNRTTHSEKGLTKVVRSKIPNFALIHQRAYDKMENIKEMSERKAVRAKLLLSGRKPPSENSPKSSTRRKELKFSPAPLKSLSSNENKNNGAHIKSNISVTKINDLSPSKSNPKAANKENILKPIEKKKELLKAKSLIPKPKLHNIVTAEKKGFTRFGFKIGTESVKKVSKDEQVKAVTTKSKITKNTLDERRNLIQGVRSNRRFELLMNMRMK